MADDPELEGIKVRADAMRRLGITDPHVVDYEYRLWMVERLRKVGVELFGGFITRKQAGSMAQTVSLCTGMMLTMASMLAEEGKRKMADAKKSEEVEKETRAGKGGDNTIDYDGELVSQSHSGAAVFFKRYGDGRSCWLPKSQITGITLPSKSDDYPLMATVRIPRWLAEKKGLLG